LIFVVLIDKLPISLLYLFSILSLKERFHITLTLLFSDGNDIFILIKD
jgi:hypothetical protein